MSNFNEIVPRRINIIPARQATLQEAQSAPVPFDKYYGIKPTRSIGKLDTYIVLPAFTVPQNSLKYIGQYIFQYNVAMPAPFYIMNLISNDVTNALTCILTVKWRVGTTVYRYFVAGNQVFDLLGVHLNVQAFPYYANQLIPANCCFEVYLGALNGTNPPNVGLLNPFKIKTNYKSDPPDPDTTELDIGVAGPYLRTNESVAFPVNFPVTNKWTDTVFNTN